MNIFAKRFSSLAQLSQSYKPSTSVYSLKTDESINQNIELCSKIFGTYPRIDIIHNNLKWQATYRVVDWRSITTRADLTYRTQKKPWPQKGLGKARHGNKRTHIWIGGGQCNGPRGPQSYFSILPFIKRVKGLTSSLTVKHLQDDFKVVDSLKFSDDLEDECKSLFSSFDSLSLVDAEEEDGILVNHQVKIQNTFLKASQKLREILDNKNWIESVLFVTDSLEEIESYAMLGACNAYSHYIDYEVSERSSAFPVRVGDNPSPRSMHPGRGLTLMPVESLNVWSLISHDKVVVTEKALSLIEERLGKAINSVHCPDGKDQNKFSPTIHYPNWMTQKDLVDDTDHRIKRERHFTGRILDIDEVKRNLT